MEHALSELPLAIFTTLAPIGAGGFIMLAFALLTTRFSPEALQKIDRLTLVPLAIVLIGLIASFAHLAAPLAAVYIFSGTGVSPLTNEIIAALVFVVIAALYCVLAILGKLSTGARKVGILLTAIAGLVFSYFIGSAYMVDTIASWNTWYVPLTIIGFTLIGGAIIGTLVLAFAGSLDEAVQGRFKVLAIVLALVGAVLAVGALTLQYFMVGSLSSLLVSGSQVTGELTVFLVVFGVGIALSLAIVLYTLLKDRRGTFSLAATVLVTASIFIGRLMFYSMFMTVGI